MSRFTFRTCPETEAFCETIATEMVRLFGISEGEAIGRINKRWQGLDLSDRQDIIFHETDTHWAKDIYYGHDSSWWKNEAEALPLPYP